MRKLLWGSLAGIVATGLMSGVIALGKLFGLLHTPPPKQITANVEQEAGVEPASMPPPSFHVSWLLAHLAYGAASGAVYAFLRPLLPKSVPLAGSIYGIALWAANYVGLLPVLGLYPWPSEDSSGRAAVMIAAHEVYGLSVAEVEQRLAFS